MSAADLIRSRMNWDGLFETEEDTACENSGEEVREENLFIRKPAQNAWFGPCILFMRENLCKKSVNYLFFACTNLRFKIC